MEEENFLRTSEPEGREDAVVVVDDIQGVGRGGGRTVVIGSWSTRAVNAHVRFMQVDSLARGGSFRHPMNHHTRDLPLLYSGCIHVVIISAIENHTS